MLERSQHVSFGTIEVGGLWGRRLRDSVRAWSLQVNDDLLLNCFRHRPGVQPFIGEHVGKYADGAILCNYVANDPALWDKVDGIMRALVQTQEEDGYLGTYLPETRWVDMPPLGRENYSWDPWVAKYCLLAMLQYERLRGDASMTPAAVKLGRLLERVYGAQGAYNLNLSDEHAGLASGSLLEALALWYEHTGEASFLALADRIVTYYWTEDAPFTPHLLANMTQEPPALHRIGHGKAYEMMSCFVGLAAYARVSGQQETLERVKTVHHSIAAHYKQLNGCMSSDESFGRPDNFGERDTLENCVAFTWIQLSACLFEMTGDNRYMDCVEETATNHILQSIAPDASTWNYFTTLTGPKTFAYGSQLPDTEAFKRVRSAPLTCCHTNGQRALGLVPQYLYTLSAEGIVHVNLLWSSARTLDTPRGRLSLRIDGDFPRSGAATLTVTAEQATEVCVRVPGWCQGATVNGRACGCADKVTLPVEAGHNTFEIVFPMRLRLLSAGRAQRGKCAIAYGPMLLAIDSCPDGWTFDEIALRLSGAAPLAQVRTTFEDGWVCCTLPARRVPCDAGELCWANVPGGFETADVQLRPFLLAGLGGNLTYARRWEEEGLPYDRDSGVWTAYRVLFPCLYEDAPSPDACPRCAQLSTEGAMTP